MKRLLFILLCSLLLAPASFAILDTNNNGLSDLWEKAHNEGDLFAETFNPEADPDLDGWTNAQEAAAGTDPLDPNPPDGLLRPTTAHVPAAEGILEAVTVTWPTLIGKQYTLFFAFDLAEESWIQFEEPFIGNESEVTYGFVVNEFDKRFWRVAVADVDTDGDGLTDAEEGILGLDPSNATADSDTDGMPDSWEILNGLNPFDSSDALLDPDVDGLTNAQEFATGRDPKTYDVVTKLQRDWEFVESRVVETTQSDGTKDWEGNWSDGSAASVRMAHEEFQHVLQQRDQNPYTGAWWLGGLITDSGITWLDPDGRQLANSSSDDTYTAPDGGPTTRTTSYLASKYKVRLARNIATGPKVSEHYIALIYSGIGESQTLTTFSVELTIPENQQYSQTVELKTDHPNASIGLLPVEVAPEVLAVNSDFDEGRIDSATGYAIPDCDDTDIALEAVRNHLDGKFAINERVTDDMHPGFFGVNPSNLGDDFWASANVTIRKIDKTDPATGHPESGHIRLYGKWGDGASEYRAIVPYNFETLATANLATGGINGTSESVYGAASPFPDGTSYFIEGVQPGKITLEWRYQKGSVDFKHEQSFEVCTHKNALQWKHELAYKIRLETSNDPSGQINTIAVMLPGESYKERMERASEYYDFYHDCFLTPMRSKPLHSQAMTWPGLARLAGSQVVGGLSDSEYARWLLEVGSIPGYALPPQIQDELLQWSLSETKDLQQSLFTGARTIFQSIGWQMHAYRSSGYRALDWVETETGEAEVSALSGVWKRLRIGILNHDKVTLDKVALDITDREQNVTIVPTWSVISGLFLGTTNWMFSVLGENSCTPSGKDFREIFPQFPVPTGSLANTANRWTWIQPTTADGILDTWNKHPLASRDSLVRNTLEQDARRFSRVHQIAYQFPTYLYLPIWVWDNEDVP